MTSFANSSNILSNSTTCKCEDLANEAVIYKNAFYVMAAVAILMIFSFIFLIVGGNRCCKKKTDIVRGGRPKKMSSFQNTKNNLEEDFRRFQASKNLLEFLAWKKTKTVNPTVHVHRPIISTDNNVNTIQMSKSSMGSSFMNDEDEDDLGNIDLNLERYSIDADLEDELK